MKKLKEFLKSEKFKILLTSILFIFALFYAIFMAYHDETAKIENNYELVEKKDLNNNISKKSLVSVENNNYYAYLYLDFYREAYVKTDIYYSYSIDETNGDLLAIITTIDNEFTDIYNDYTYTSTYTFSSIPKINNNTDFLNVSYIDSVVFEFTLIRYQTSDYILPQITCTIFYTINDFRNELIIYGNAGFDEGIIVNGSVDGYQWEDSYKEDFTINDYSFSLSNKLGNTYYDIGFSNGFDDGKIIGFEEGKQVQKDLYEKNDTAISKIWDILENGIETALNVLSIEILPGIPLTICIIVPLIFGIIFFIWKGGAQ